MRLVGVLAVVASVVTGEIVLSAWIHLRASTEASQERFLRGEKTTEPFGSGRLCDGGVIIGRDRRGRSGGSFGDDEERRGRDRPAARPGIGRRAVAFARV